VGVMLDKSDACPGVEVDVAVAVGEISRAAGLSFVTARKSSNTC